MDWERRSNLWLHNSKRPSGHPLFFLWPKVWPNQWLKCPKTPIMPFWDDIMYSNKGLPKSLEALYSQRLHGGASRNRTTDTWIFSTMLYTVYQALTGISDQIKTIFVSQFVPVCPVMPIWLLQQHHLPRLDEIACPPVWLEGDRSRCRMGQCTWRT